MPRILFVLFLFGSMVHATWATTISTPVDLDAQYYLLVARHLARGEGAVTASLWNLAILPDALPMPADLHWMPLPSRVLVPFLWIWPAHGDRVVQVLLAALWGPLAALLAREAGGSERAALGAGLLAASGGVYVRYLSSPDCYGLFGVLGTLGLFAVARQRWAGALLVALLAGFTRNDGFLLGAALGFGFGGWRGLSVGVAGIAPLAVWSARGIALVGRDAYVAGRSLATGSADYLSLFDGVDHAPLSLVDRLLAPLHAAPDLVETLVTPGLILLTPFTAWSAWQVRERGWVRAFTALVLVAPAATVMLAPAVAVHGTLHRTAAAVFPAHLALAAVGLGAAGVRATASRGYPPWFIPVVFGGAFWVVVIGMGCQRAAVPPRPSECPLVQRLPNGAAVLTSRPLEMALLCERPGVLITRSTPKERVTEIVRRYGVVAAVASPDQPHDEGSVHPADLDRLLPGWKAHGPWVRVAP